MSSDATSKKQLIDMTMIEKLATLSRIRCSQEQKVKLLTDLKSIVAYIEQLNEVNTELVNECTYVTESLCETPLREDLPANTLSKESFMSGTPEHIGGMVRIPTVLKQ